MKDSYLSQRIFKGGRTVISFTLASSPIGYLIRILYSRTLSIEDFGLFYAALAFFSILVTYNDLGFGYSVAYLIPKFFKKGDFKKTWTAYKYDQIIEFATSILISLLLIILASWLASNYFKVSYAKNIIYVFSIYFIANSLVSALNKLFTGLQKEKYYASIEFFRLIFIFLYSLLFWFIDKGNIFYFAFAWTLAYIMVALIYNYLLYKNFKFLTRKFDWDKGLFKKMFSYAIPSLLTTSVYTLITSTDTVFLTLFKGVKEVGIYNIVIPLISIPSIFLSPLNQMIFPLTSHLMEGEKKKIKHLLNFILKTVPFIGLYFALFISSFSSTLTLFLFGGKWVGLIETAVTILSFGFILSSISSYLTTILGGMGKVKERLKASIVISVINIVFGSFLIFKFGVIGAAISNTIIYFLSLIIYGQIIKSQMPFKYPLFYYLKLLTITAMFFLLIKLVNFEPTGLIQILTTGFIYTLFMVLVAYLLGIIDKNMLRLLLKRK